MVGVFDKNENIREMPLCRQPSQLAACNKQRAPRESRVCFNMLGLRAKPACSSLQLKPKNQLSSVRRAGEESVAGEIPLVKQTRKLDRTALPLALLFPALFFCVLNRQPQVISGFLERATN
jgi:hypothetical protein